MAQSKTQLASYEEDEIKALIAKSQKPIDIQKLNDEAKESDRLNEALIAEQQTNVLIYAGEHYAKVADNFKRLLYNRGTRSEAQERSMLKLTMNHMHSICNVYINNVLTYSPTTHAKPRNAVLLQQVSEAEQSNAVLKDILKTNNEYMLINEFANNYTVIGEAIRYVYYDPNYGKIVGYKNKPETENLFQQEIDEFGNVINEIPLPPEPDYTQPIFEGGIVIETLNPYDVFLQAGVETVEQSRFVGVKKLLNRNIMIDKIYKDSTLSQDEKLKKIQWFSDDNRESFSSNDRMGRNRNDNPDLFLVRYFFYKPCVEFPKGRIFETVEQGIISEYDLQEDENGMPLFPIKIMPCIQISGMPRGVSIIRQGRVLQAEINRTMSKTAEHQILLGDDKIVTTGEDGLTEGARIGGVRHLSLKKGYQGYQVIEGRSGAQFVPYLELLIDQLYFMYKVETDDAKNNSKSGQDINVMLYKNMSQKRNYIQFAKKFEIFLCELSRDCLKLAKRYYTEQKTIAVIGTDKQVNISEFKNSQDTNYSIEIEPVTGDAETQMGSFVAFKEIMQFVGNSLDKKTLGNVLANIPFIPNGKAIMSNMLVHENRAKDVILALDRGEYPEVQKYENHEVILQELATRMVKSDFLIKTRENPQIKALYERQIAEREQYEQQKVQAIRQANQGDIPMGGDLINIQLWKTVPTADGKGTKQETWKIPAESFEWLTQRLTEQQKMEEVMNTLPKEMQADIVNNKGVGINVE